MQKLILYLETPDFSSVSWILLAESDAPVICLHGTVASLQELDKSHLAEVIVIAPPAEVLLTHATLPKLNRQRLMQALPFALEEQLLSEVSELHFAIGNYQNDLLPVAVVAKTQIEAWLAQLLELQLTPSQLLPAPLAIPYTENTWHIKIMATYAIVRTGLASGFTCDKENLATLLGLQLAETSSPPTHIQVDNYALDAVTLPTQAFIQIHDYPEKQFLLELAQLSPAPAINLLQSPYQPRRKQTSNQPIWLRAAYLAAAWVSLVIISNLISFSLLEFQSRHLQTAINKIYLQQFPQAKALTAPKQRMAEKLQQLTHQAHTNPALLWLAQIGASLQQMNTIKIKQLDYSENKIILDLATDKVDNIDVFTQNLLQQGLSVRQQNIITTSKQATGTLIISDGSST